ncbi:MAG: hypothetical protein HY360_05230 [Verrucomicrobia bacterium]|nr:hypothetical protein [Verrucomicrobiota bacterium]
MIRLAQAFLAAFAVGSPSCLSPAFPHPNLPPQGGKENDERSFSATRKGKGSYVGDIQEWRAYPANSDEAGRIPAEYRAVLPSEAVARAWEGNGN